MNLPVQLRNPALRFLILGTGKAPIEQRWQDTANYTWDHLCIRATTNAGVLCGVGNLVVIDFDSHAAQALALPQLPPTFTVKTGGSGLSHLYYFVDTPATRRYNAAEGSRLVDVQGPRTQVVAPGSTNRETGRQYTILRDLPITHTTMEKLTRVLDSLFPQPHRQTQNPQVMSSNDDVISDLKRHTDIVKIAQHYGVTVRAGKALCPFHADKNPSLSIDRAKGLFHCFGCETSGDAIIFVELLEKCTRAEAIRKTADLAQYPLPTREDTEVRALRTLLPEVFR